MIWTRIVLAAVVSLGAAPQATPPAVSDEARLTDELAAVLRTLREDRAAWYQRQRARAAEVDAARQPVRRLEVEIAELKSREADVAKNLADADIDLAKLRREEEASAGHSASLAPALDKAVLDAVRFVGTGPAYRRQDRLLRLGADAPPGSSAGERLGRYWTFLQEELRIARSGETYSSEIPLEGGRLKPARIFRVGHLVQGYVTEDNLEVGLETPNGWMKAASPDQDKAIRSAVEVLDRRQAPALLRLPVVREVKR